MRSPNRKSTPRVIQGRVQKKNNWTASPDYYTTSYAMPVVDRKRPGEGYRHLLKKRDIDDFLALLPDWPELSKGLNAIVLAPGEYDMDGYHVPGVVHLCAWDRELWRELTAKHFEEHRDLFARLGIPCEPIEDYYLCKFEESTARAYQLLHVLLHELGHHHDLMTTRSRRWAS